jgi:hypothetical protein
VEITEPETKVDTHKEVNIDELLDFI